MRVYVPLMCTGVVSQALPDHVIGIMLVYGSREIAQAKHPRSRIMEFTIADSDDLR